MKHSALVLLVAGAAAAQTAHYTPEAKPYEGTAVYSGIIRKYLPARQALPTFSNSMRLNSVIRDGNIYLSLQDAIDLALENNLDIEYHRYDRRHAESDQLRASAGALLTFQSTGVRAGFSSASSGVLAGGSSLGSVGTSSGGGSGQSGILSGFTIQAAGSSIPNLEPLFFVSYQASHRTNPLTSSLTTGTNYLVSSARTLDYGFSKSFLSGTNVTIDFAQQSLFQNAPANDFNPSLNGNLELAITQPLLRGFSWSTNKRQINIAKNNLTVSDLNFKEQVMSTVKNVVDLYWDLVTFNENVKYKQAALAISEKFYNDNKQRLALGVTAPIDLVQSEASMQTAQLDLRSARTQALQQEMILKSALTRTGVDSLSLINARLIPTDPIVLPESEAIQPIQDMVAAALANRPELQETQITLENARINMKGVKNAMLPGLDVFVDLQNNALAGQPNTIPVPANLVGTRPTPDPYFLGNYGKIFSQVFGRNFPNYSIGFNLNVPLRNAANRADMIKNQLDLRQAQINQRQQENQIRLNVVNAWIGLEQAREAYNTAVKARKLQEQFAQGEQQKYDKGASTTQNVVLAQRDLVNTQASEVSALNSYIRARTTLDLTLGRILDVNRVNIEEAYSGRVQRSPSPLQSLPAQPSARP